MKRFIGIRIALVAFISLCGVGTSAHALTLRHGLELQGGMGHWGKYDIPAGFWEGVEFRWRPAGGIGWCAERGVGAGFTLGSGLAYRILGDEVRSNFTSGGGSVGLRYRMTVQQLALPLRVQHPVPGLPWLGIEAAVQAEYVLKAMERFEDHSAYPAIRPPQPLASDATIFESLKDEYEITYLTNRLGAAATAGLSWRTKLFHHDATLAARYERGLTPLWKDGLDRFADRLGLALRWAF